MLTALVAVDKTALSYDRLFTYRIPPSLEPGAVPGVRVLVPFGNGNRKRPGILFTVRKEDAPDTALKPVAEILDPEPVLSPELLELAAHLRNTVFCTYFDAVRLMLPPALNIRVEYRYAAVAEVQPEQLLLSDTELLVYRYLAGRRTPASEKKLKKDFGLPDDAVLKSLFEKGAVCREEEACRRTREEKLTMVRLLCAEEPSGLSAKQKKVFAFLRENEGASLKETLYLNGVSRSVADGLLKRGAVEYYERDVRRIPVPSPEELQEPPVLSGTQQNALEALRTVQMEGVYAVSLLFGVTGSGKTQVFLSLAREVVESGGGVIVLVPEISLTPQTVGQFTAMFGDRVAVVHSALSLGERLEEFQRIQNGEARVVVGTRSAVFAPVRNLQLIILDEEQEQSYKSDRTPRYHARDVAKWRAHYHATQVLLASATPSVESYYFARKGIYRLVTLEGRYSGQTLPDVYILDMAGEGPAEGSSVLSVRLKEELQTNLDRGEQSILLLNRRGYHTIVKCGECGKTACCPNCSVTLTYHAKNGALCCHYCGYMRPLSEPCPECGGTYARYQGAGTQRIEEELSALFPGARVLRTDMDTTMSRFAHEKQFGAFADHQYDILIGTQMVAKGLNFPDVTLVGVLGTDQMLYSDDFRSFERTFSLLTQVVGRAGRGRKRGRAFIQTFSPENPVLTLAASQQYPEFFQSEIHVRKLGLYPPYCCLCALGVTSELEEEAVEASEALLEALKEAAVKHFPDLPLRVLGPCEFTVYKASGRYRRRLLVKCRNDKRFRAMLRETIPLWESKKKAKKAQIFVDMYYDSY